MIKDKIAKWLGIKPVIKVRTVNANAQPWTKEHAKVLKEFFGTHVGKDFLAQLESVEIQANAWSVQGEYRERVARGIQLAHQNVRNMAQVVEEPVSYETTEEEIENALNNRINGYMS
jgi:hypothetical protein